MGVFYHEEPPSHTKRCKCLAETLKEVFSLCQTFSRRLSTTSFDEEFPISDVDEEHEVIVSLVRSRALEKQKLKLSPLREGNVTHTKAPQARVVVGDGELGERDEFLSAKSCLSRCSSSAMSGEVFYSMKTNLSRCSSLNELDLSEYWRRSIIHEFCHCEGWPFGLCRKALLLPPLPKSPSESWLLRKIQRSTKVT